jgi:DivIVA domain-containing protein
MAGGVMGLLFIVVGVAVIAGAALLISGRWRDGLEEIPADASTPIDFAADVPVGSLSAADIDEVRLDQAARGYRMEDVDDLLGRLAQEIQVKDAEIARLRAGQPDDGPPAT